MPKITGVAIILGSLVLLAVFNGCGLGGSVTVQSIGNVSVASNLTTKTEVMCMDTVVGNVSAITPNDADNAIVSMKIRRKFQNFIHNDSVVTMKRKFAIAGDAYLEISQGKGEPLNPAIPLQLIQERGLDQGTKQLINKIARAVVSATDATNNQPIAVTLKQELGKQAQTNTATGQ